MDKIYQLEIHQYCFVEINNFEGGNEIIKYKVCRVIGGLLYVSVNTGNETFVPCSDKLFNGKYSKKDVEVFI